MLIWGYQFNTENNKTLKRSQVGNKKDQYLYVPILLFCRLVNINIYILQYTILLFCWVVKKYVKYSIKRITSLVLVL